MRPSACHFVIPVTVYLTCVICLDIAQGDNTTDGDQKNGSAYIATEHSDFTSSAKTPSVNTALSNDSSIQWLNGYQAEPTKQSNNNLAFLPGLAILFLCIFIFCRACQWCRDSAKIKERGCSYDVASYVILVQGDKDFDDVDIADNNDTVNSLTSFMRMGVYETITSTKSLQYRMDSQMYDTVTSYSNYLHKMEKENNMEIELKERSGDDIPSPKRTTFLKKTTKSRDPNHMKIPKDSRFSIKPALDNYMRLKGTNMKPLMTPKSVRYDSVEKIAGISRKSGSKMNIIVNGASSESLMHGAYTRKCDRQISIDSHRSTPTKAVSKAANLPNLRRTVSENAKGVYFTARNELNKKRKLRSKNVASLIFSEEIGEFQQSHTVDKQIRMVDAGTQADVSRRPRSTSSPLGTRYDVSRRQRTTSSSSASQCNFLPPRQRSISSPAETQYVVDHRHISSSSSSGLESSHSSTDSDLNTATANEQVGCDGAVIGELANDIIQHDDDLPVIQDDLKDDRSPHKEKFNTHSVCAIVHNVDIPKYRTIQHTETHPGEINLTPQNLGEVIKRPDINYSNDKQCQSNGSICYANITDNILIESDKRHSSVSNMDDVIMKDYRDRKNGLCQFNRKSLPCVANKTSEGHILEKGCQLMNGDGRVSNWAARRSSYQNISKSRQENVIEIQNDLGQCTFIEMVH